MRELDRLIRLFSRLPGLGPRSARRLALSLIKRPDTLLLPLQQALADVAAAIRTCQHCGNIDTSDPCAICQDNSRDHSVLCIVEEVGDLWAIERAGGFRGSYHVLGGRLSALDGISPEDLSIAILLERLNRPASPEKSAVTEVILATNLTVEGQATAHYLAGLMKERQITVTRLAHGVPVGGELDYLDDGTLRAALNARHTATD